MTDFPDHNLAHLHARTASGRPQGCYATGEEIAKRGRYVYDIDEEIALPSEPQRDVVIEALHPEGGMAVAWRDADGLRWVSFAGTRNRRPEDWANIVEAAIRFGWTLVVREQGPEPTPGQLRAVGR
jgi:hypothetical protein